jgi:hypothetical protein
MLNESKGSKVLGDLKLGNRVEGWCPKAHSWIKVQVTKVSSKSFQGIDKNFEKWTGLTHWRSSAILTSAQEMESDSHLQVLNVASGSLELQKQTQTALKSLASDTPESLTMGTSTTMTGTEIKPRLTSSQDHHHVSPSQCKESDLQRMTSAIVSPEFLKRSLINSPSSSQSKTLEVYSTVRIAPELTEVTSGTFYSTFPTSGSIVNGRCYQADTLPRPSLEKERFWLESLGGLSHSGIGQAPGWSKSETQLHKLGVLERGEVINPDLAEAFYRVPFGWTNRQVITTAGEFLAEMEQLGNVEQPSEMHSIPDLQGSRSTAFFTCPSCAKRLEFTNSRANCKCFQWFVTLPWNEREEWNEPLDPDDVWRVGDHVKCKSNNAEGTVKGLEQREILGGYLNYLIIKIDGAASDVVLEPDQVWRIHRAQETEFPLELLETQKKRRGARGKEQASGWLEHYTKEKKLKSGASASYPRVDGERDPENPEHWYWAYRYEEKREGAKSDNGYVTRAVSLPQCKVEAVRLAIARQWSVEKILQFVRGE